MTRNYAEEDSVKKGLASLAVSLGASEGDVAQIDSQGNATLAAPNGGSSAPLEASAHLIGMPIAGGYQNCVTLVPGGTLEQNVVAGSACPWVFDPSMTFGVQVDAPAFSAGTLSIRYAELDICNADGTERIAVGLDTPLALSSGESVAPLIFDDAAETPGAGSDLVFTDGVVVSTAGGWYVASFFVQFTVSADFAG